jgi:hypothetical protein
MSTNSPESRTVKAQVVPPPSRLAQPPRTIALAILLLVIVFFGLIRYRLRDMPLERDEGEYAYSGQLLLQGIPPDKLAYNMKLPGIYAAYAAIMAVFGETPAGIHVGLLLVNAASIVVLYLLTSLLFGRLAGLIAGSSFALLSTSASVMGFEAHATNFVVLPALAGILLAVVAADSRRTTLNLSEWHLLRHRFSDEAARDILRALLLVVPVLESGEARSITADTIRSPAIFAAGAILPYAVTCFLLYRARVFRTFWF